MLNYLIEENEVINDFQNFLEEYEIDKNNINYENVNNYLQSCYFDVFDTIDSFEIDACIIKDEMLEEIENIIYNNFKINMED